MTPSHRFVLVAAAIFPCAGAPRPWAGGPDPPDVDALLQHLDDLYRSKSSVARIETDVTTTRSTRNMRLRAWTRGEEEVLVLIEAPPREAGTATLRVGNNLWNYLPKIARTIRVPPAAMLGSWMGTDFTNDDLVKESSLRKDFAARYLTTGRQAIGWGRGVMFTAVDLFAPYSPLGSIGNGAQEWMRFERTSSSPSVRLSTWSALLVTRWIGQRLRYGPEDTSASLMWRSLAAGAQRTCSEA